MFYESSLIVLSTPSKMNFALLFIPFLTLHFQIYHGPTSSLISVRITRRLVSAASVIVASFYTTEVTTRVAGSSKENGKPSNSQRKRN